MCNISSPYYHSKCPTNRCAANTNLAIFHLGSGAQVLTYEENDRKCLRGAAAYGYLNTTNRSKCEDVMGSHYCNYVVTKHEVGSEQAMRKRHITLQDDICKTTGMLKVTELESAMKKLHAPGRQHTSINSHNGKNNDNKNKMEDNNNKN